jgi:hypothetical protein
MLRLKETFLLIIDIGFRFWRKVRAKGKLKARHKVRYLALIRASIQLRLRLQRGRAISITKLLPLSPQTSRETVIWLRLVPLCVSQVVQAHARNPTFFTGLRMDLST